MSEHHTVEDLKLLKQISEKRKQDKKRKKVFRYSEDTCKNRGLQFEFERSPKWSAIRHSRALRISEKTVQQILHKDLNFDSYKMSVVEEL